MMDCTLEHTYSFYYPLICGKELEMMLDFSLVIQSWK